MWSGVISFGLVNIPVKLFTAVRDRSVHLKMLSPDGRHKLRRKMVSEESGHEYGFHEAARGYEVAPDQYVIVSEEEVERLRPDAGKAINIRDFVEIDEIDPIYFDRPYYIAPDEKGARAYRLLLEALRESGKAAVARLVMQRKEYLAVLRPKGDLLCLETMRYPDEIVPVDEIPGIPDGDVVTPSMDEMHIARQLIHAMSAHFRPAAYRDDFREALLDLIQRKAEGREIVVREPEPRELAPVVDLRDALERSLAQKGGRAAGRRRAVGETEPAAGAAGSEATPNRSGEVEGVQGEEADASRRRPRTSPGSRRRRGA